MNTAKCKECERVLPRIPTEKKNIYKDASGRNWNGRKCPDCHSLVNKAYAGTTVEFEGRKWNRKCTFCQKALKPPRFFYHEDCGTRNVTEECNTDLIYFVSELQWG